MLTLNDGRSELWQWDTCRTLAVDADCSQVHFSNKVFGRSIDVDVADGVAIIPDVLLQTGKDLNVWAFVGTAENGYTKISKTFKVNRRNKPSDYVFTPPDQTTLAELSGRLDRIEESQDPEAIKNAIEDYLSQNPVEIPVQSVNGKTGAVELTAEDVGAVPVPETASVGQTIRVKVVDETGKPTEWEAVDAPSGGGAVDDVQIDGVSIVKNGVANVPVSIGDNRIGQPCLVRVSSLNYGIYLREVDGVPGHLAVRSASNWSINNGRNEPAPLFMNQTDRTIKACMCDGVGAAWTDAERIAALLRMGCTVDDNGFVKWTAQEVAE